MRSPKEKNRKACTSTRESSRLSPCAGKYELCFPHWHVRWAGSEVRAGLYSALRYMERSILRRELFFTFTKDVAKACSAMRGFPQRQLTSRSAKSKLHAACAALPVNT